MDVILIIGFLHTLRVNCDNNGTPQMSRNEIGSLCFENTAAAAPTERLSLKSKLSHSSDKEGILRSYVQNLNHFLEYYATGDFIAGEKT